MPMPTDRSAQRVELYRTLVFVAVVGAFYLVVVNWGALRHLLTQLL